MLSKKEMGLIALAGVGIVGIGVLSGFGDGGSGGKRAGQILGSPGAVVGGLPSAGTGSQKQIAAVTGYMAPGTKTAVSPEMRKEFGVGFVPSKTAFAGKQQVSPTYIPEAATQAYVKAGGTGYVAPTFNGVGGKIIGGRYTPPAGLYPSKTQAGLTAKGLATQKKVSARSTGRAPSATKLTSKGAAVKKRVAARKARSG